MRNVSPREYRAFLTSQGCNLIRFNGGHEIWSRNGLLRSITFQSHIEPVPEFIIKNGLRTLGITRNEFMEWLHEK